MTQPIELPFRDIPAILEAVFESAKRASEFEYCRALLRERSATGEIIDPLFEGRRYLHQNITLLEAPIEDSLKLRLMLSLYCHVIEMRDLYDVIVNLLRVTTGAPYSIDPFATDPRGNTCRAATIEEKVGRIFEWAVHAGIEDLGELMADTLVPEVRLAFSESVYSLDEATFYYRPRNGETAGQCKLSLEWMLPRINRGVTVALTFIDTAQRHLLAYQANKILDVKSPEGLPQQIELLARPGLGLHGYREISIETVPLAPESASTTEIPSN